MPTINYSATNFPPLYGPSLVGRHSISVSWTQLVWAAISVGKAQLQHLTQYGVFSIFEMTYRVAILYANLLETSQGRLCRSSAYDGLDPSEKGAISYFIGLTMAKLFAGQLLNVPWLMNLDVYRQLLQPILVGASRPDLVGLRASDEWIVVEAKGRTHGFENSALQAAKNQTAQLTTIQGLAPVLRVGVLTYFAAPGVLEVAIDDPRGENRGRYKKVSDIPLTPELVWGSYYHPFQAFIRDARAARRETLGGLPYQVVAMPDLGFSVGVPDIVLETGIPVPQFHVHQPQIPNHTEFIGPDGIFVRLGTAWSDENMRLEPQERNS